MFSLSKIRSIADYQFGKGVGAVLFPDSVDIVRSRGTGRIRHIYLNGKLIVTLRPNDGFFSLTINGGMRLISANPVRAWVQVQDDVAELIAEGKTVFAKHVKDCDRKIRPREEVVIINSQNRVIAVGRAILTGEEMMVFNRGVAVRIRHGTNLRIKREKEA
jgi:predicted RNA-binding protein (TIGR00451 family)